MMRLYFSGLTDKRQKMKTRHDFLELIILTIAAVIGGCNGWDEIEDFCRWHADWFRNSLGLELAGGIPSADTIARIWRMIDPNEFHSRFEKWAEATRKKIKGEVIGIDGKTSRGSGFGDCKAVHIVSAWLRDQEMVLGQIAVREKSNEITAVPELLKQLYIKGCIITADAMSCQKEIARVIKKKGADYVIGLKGNQGSLLEYAEEYFEDALKHPELYAGEIDTITTHDEGHGRTENRTYYLMHDFSGFPEAKDWPGLKAIGMVISTVTNHAKGETYVEKRYYISSTLNVEDFSRAVRQHWGIEASLHHSLDVSFQEDASKIRKDASAENMATIRHYALSALKKLNVGKDRVSANRKRKMCSYSNELLYATIMNVLSPERL